MRINQAADELQAVAATPAQQDALETLCALAIERDQIAQDHQSLVNHLAKILEEQDK